MTQLTDGTQVLNGSYGKVYHDGEWLMHVTGLQLDIEPEYEEVPLPGRRTPGQKLMKINMSGSMDGYAVSRDFGEKIGTVLKDDAPSFVTELMAEMTDPDNPGMSGFYRVKGVQFQKIPAPGYTHGEIVKDEIPFLFTGFEKV